MTRDEALGILGLESDATLDDAKKAYRDLVKVIHPDKDPSPGAKQRFILVQDAYEVITNQHVQGEHGRAEEARRERESRERAERERQEREAREQEERKRQEKERAERQRQERARKEQQDREAHAVSYFKRGRQRYELEQNGDAIKDFDAAIELKPDYDEAYRYRGKAKHGLRQYTAAISDYDEAIRQRQWPGQSPTEILTYYWRGRAKFELNQYRDAIADFVEAIRLKAYKEGLDNFKVSVNG